MWGLISTQEKETNPFIFLGIFFSSSVAFPLGSPDQEVRMFTLASLTTILCAFIRNVASGLPS